MEEHRGTIKGIIPDTDGIQANFTKITKIEFDNPILMQEGDSLRVNFVLAEEGMKCDVILETADGRKMVVGENVEDIIEDSDGR